MATFKPFVATDKFSMQTFNNKLQEIVDDFNADNAKVEAAVEQVKTQSHMTLLKTITPTGGHKRTA